MEAADTGYDVHVLRSSRGPFVNLNYLLVDRRTREAALIDASWDMDGLSARLAESGARLSTVLLTHSHYDHVHLVPRLAESFRPRIFISRHEADYYRFRCPGLEVFAPMDRIEVGDARAVCLDTPGHTAGSACFLFRDSLFSGDTLFTEGCGICHAPGGCPHRMFRSLQLLKMMAAGHEAVYPGHAYWTEPGKPFAAVAMTNRYLALDDEAAFVRYAMRKERLRAPESFRPL